MRDIIFWSMFVIGIIVGVWVGFGVMFIGGIVQLLNSVKHTPVNSGEITLGVLQLLFAAPVGWIVGVIIIGIGMAFSQKD